ncbi:MAG: RIP metalloprotease RseP [candidate division KSB1 bacterium]|nr:RIP metalloprotease RseP [candidate division KSB1 bacterium]
MPVTIVSFIIVLGVLIFVHEFGHFLAAKAVGIRVERFSLGFPPRLIGKKIGDTDYCISAIPFGGYVKMAGMIDESLDTDSIKGEPWEFMSKPLWARFLAIFSGPLMNLLLAIVVFGLLAYWAGVGVPVGPVVGEVQPGMPAEKAGFQPGDHIVEIDGQRISSWEQLTRVIHASAGKPLTIIRQRNGNIDTVSVTPVKDAVQGIGLIGIAPQMRTERVGPLRALASGASYCWYLSKLLGRSLALMATGQVSWREGLGGPVRIAQMAGESARRGFSSFLAFLGFISLNLGWINLLPVPALDGGHLVLLLIEGVSRRPVSNKVRVIVQQIGMALLIAIMILAVINDLIRIL